MIRLGVALIACLVGATWASSANAATIIKTGPFDSGAFLQVGGSTALGPGKYRFRVSFSAPVFGFGGDIIKQTIYDEFCDFGSGGAPVPCGGNDVPTFYELAAVTPTRYQANVAVNRPFSVPLSSDPFVRLDQVETCCAYSFSFEGIDKGEFAFSVSPVPEPATWAMMIVGFGLIGVAIRRRKPQVRVAY
jgi:hypothetical protein